MTEIRRLAVAGLTVGSRIRVTRRFDEKDVRAFGDISRDYNPVHYDPRFAAVKGFRDRICHGLLVAGMMTEIGGQIGWLASGMNFRFKQPVYFGDTIECTLTITAIDPDGKARAAAVYRNQRSELVLEGELFGILPEADARSVLQMMVAEGDSTNGLRDENGSVSS